MGPVMQELMMMAEKQAALTNLKLHISAKDAELIPENKVTFGLYFCISKGILQIKTY